MNDVPERKMTLYDFVWDFAALKALVEDEMTNEDGSPKELDDDTRATLLEFATKWKDDFEAKIDRVMKYRSNLKANVEQCESEAKIHRDEADRLVARAKTWETRQRSLDWLVYTVMGLLNKRKIETTLFTVYLQKNAPSLVIDDPDAVPVDYKMVDLPRIISADVKAALIAGAEVPGARLVQVDGLRVK